MDNHLSKSQESFCENMGLFGVLISATCLGQTFFFMNLHWLAFTFIAIYTLSLIGFILLMKKSHLATTVLIVSSALVFGAELMMLVSLVFSLVLLILFIYLVVTLFLVYGAGIPMALKQKYFTEKAEEDNWAGKI
ncbi:MAG: hypothetical protein V4722_20475 [Bacteroidota bacterium]